MREDLYLFKVKDTRHRRLSFSLVSFIRSPLLLCWTFGIGQFLSTKIYLKGNYSINRKLVDARTTLVIKVTDSYPIQFIVETL